MNLINKKERLFMEGLLKILFELDEYNQVLETIKNQELPLIISGVFESQKAHIASGILKELDRPSIFIAVNEVSAKKVYQDMKNILGDRVLFYPSKEIVLYDIEAQGHDITFQRLSAIKDIIYKKNFILILSIDALLSKVMPEDMFLKYSKTIKKGERYSINELTSFFINCGYQYSHMVEGKGQFSVRGEIIDIFPINQDNPFRIDFFDDFVETIKEFDITSQRSIEESNSIFIFPARAKTFVPLDFSVPIFANHAPPSTIILDAQQNVSTLFTDVGMPMKPRCAGKGGLLRGSPLFPSADSIRADSSPHTYAPAPIWIFMSKLKPFLPPAFLPSTPSFLICSRTFSRYFLRYMYSPLR